MGQKKNSRNVLIGLYLVLIHILLGFLIYDKLRGKESADLSKIEQPVTELPAPYQFPNENAPPTNSTIPANQPKPAEINANSVNSTVIQNLPAAGNGKLLIPVVGVKKSDLTDTFNDARSEGRVHNAIDIMAKGGTPVVAAADGEIAKFFDSKLGGITIYQYSLDKKSVYYYAHLQKRVDNLTEHEFVKQGTLIGYVGDTGNAGTGNFHLHFAVSSLDDPKRYWEGTEINPYPLLKDGLEAK